MLKYKLVIITIVLTYSHNVASQINDTIFENKYDYCFSLNDNIFYQSKQSKLNRLIVNGKPIDSTGLHYNYIYYYDHNFVGINFKSNEDQKNFELHSINDSTWNIIKQAEFKGVYYTFFTNTKNLYITNTIYDSIKHNQIYLTIFDISQSVFIDTINLSHAVQYNSVDSFIQLSDSLCLFSTCEPPDGGEKPGLFLINLRSHKLENVTYLYQKYTSGISFSIGTQSYKNRVFYFNGYDPKSVTKEEYENDGYALYYDTIIHIDIVLNKRLYYQGMNVKNNVASGYYFSDLDNDKDCIIKYDYDYALEKLFYKLKNDFLISKENIRDMSSSQLDLLQKMVYAKHNYKFENHYYQAYFNMFYFYNFHEMVENRKLNIDKHLTKNDKLNLKIIEKALSQFK